MTDYCDDCQRTIDLHGLARVSECVNCGHVFPDKEMYITVKFNVLCDSCAQTPEVLENFGELMFDNEKETVVFS